MNLLLVIYTGSRNRLVPELFDRHHTRGYTELRGGHGSGDGGRREGTRAWPGDASVFFSLVPNERIPELTAALREQKNVLEPGESLHVAVLPTDIFF